MVSEEGSGFIAMWEGNDVVYEFIVQETDEETFRHVLGSLTRIAEDEWAASLPDDIVTDRAEAVTTYLEGIPLPRDFDSAALEEGPVEHWYQVAADTVGAVTCSWIQHWIDAKDAGDAEAIQQAVGAMATSSDWQVLNDMSSVGDYPKVVEEYADAMAGDGTIVAGSVTTVEATYQEAFGCGS